VFGQLWFWVLFASRFAAQFARERAAFIARLSPLQRERLKGFETVGGDWRDYRDLLRQ
jgi:hypothetical protein